MKALNRVLLRAAKRAEGMKKINQQISETRRELLNTKPRSRRRIELETRLRDLVIKQLRTENRKKVA